MKMQIQPKLLFTLVFVMTAACSDNPVVPKLAPVESFETVQIVQNISGAELSYPAVDILLVIDGSGSMGSHQNNMQANIDQFLERLTEAKLDYQIAVTISGYKRDGSLKDQYPVSDDPNNSGLFHTADIHDLKPYFVTNTTPRGTDLLKQRIRVGTGSDATETFFGPVLDAIEHFYTSPENMGFFRENAYFVPIFVTDTEDQTSNGDGADPVTFFRRLVAFKGTADLIAPYSVHIPVSYGRNPPCSRDPVPRSDGPSRIEEFLHLAGGNFYDLCASDFGVQLSKLGEDLVSRVATSFELEEIPDPDTISVTFGDLVIPNDPLMGWVYYPETNTIHLGAEIDLPRDLSAKIRVQFQRANSFRQ